MQSISINLRTSLTPKQILLGCVVRWKKCVPTCPTQGLNRGRLVHWETSVFLRNPEVYRVPLKLNRKFILQAEYFVIKQKLKICTNMHRFPLQTHRFASDMFTNRWLPKTLGSRTCIEHNKGNNRLDYACLQNKDWCAPRKAYDSGLH